MKSGNSVSYPMVESMREYLYRMVELGAVEGPVGEMSVSPDLAQILHAAHHLLAGGKVQIQILEEGEKSVVEELEEKVRSATNEANEINRQAGTYVTIM